LSPPPPAFQYRPPCHYWPHRLPVFFFLIPFALDLLCLTMQSAVLFPTSIPKQNTPAPPFSLIAPPPLPTTETFFFEPAQKPGCFFLFSCIGFILRALRCRSIFFTPVPPVVPRPPHFFHHFGSDFFFSLRYHFKVSDNLFEGASISALPPPPHPV